MYRARSGNFDNFDAVIFWKILIKMLREILITLPMFVCAFWLIALLADSRSRNRSKQMLSFFMLSAFLLYLCHAIYFNREYRIYSYVDSLYTFCSLSVYPLYYLYIRSLTNRELFLKDFWVLIPSLLVSLFSFSLYMGMSAEESEAFVRKVLYHQSLEFDFSFLYKLQLVRIKLSLIVFLVQIIFVFNYGFRRIKAYHLQLADYYSNMERKELSPIKVMLYFFVSISIVSVFFSIVGRTPFLNSDWLLVIPSVLFGALLYSGGMIGFKQDFTIDDLARDQDRDDALESRDEYIVSSESDIRMKYLKENLVLLMKEQKLYTQTDLRISDLSKLLGSNRSYVSGIINHQMNTTFADYVNNYRIEHAKEMLLDFQKPVTMGEIAEHSGFPSESTFYRVFKQKMEMSPKVWRKQQMQKEMKI
jgi:AraC-like DNA-binding protein